MQQPQGLFPNSDQPDHLSAFTLNRKNPYDQPDYASPPSTRYTSAYQPSSGESERNSLLLIADGTSAIDKQLSRGWYACYKYWLFFVAFPNIFSLLYNFLDPLVIDNLFFSSTQCAIEVAYVITMFYTLKKKKLGTAICGLRLAIVDFPLWIWAFIVLVLSMLKYLEYHESSGVSGWTLMGYVCLFIGHFFYYWLGVVLPAWKIKGLIEKREDALRKDINLYDFES